MQQVPFSVNYSPLPVKKKKKGKGQGGRGGRGGRGGHGGRGGYGGRGRGRREVGGGGGFNWGNNDSTYEHCTFTNNYY